MRPDTRCPACQHPVREAQQADTPDILLLDMRPASHGTLYDQTGWNDHTPIVTPSDQAQPGQPRGITYSEHACTVSLNPS